MSDPTSSLAALQQRIGYRFRDPGLLTRAVTHASALQRAETEDSNQRLEFLGDAVLQLILTEAIFKLYPDLREGALSKRRAALAKGESLTHLAREIGLDACLLLSVSEEQSGGRERASTLEDAFEALVGAIYLDSDLPTTRQVVLALHEPLADRLDKIVGDQNPKGRLQELVQPEHGNLALRYEVTRVTGEDHAREYHVAVYMNDGLLGTGAGPSKKSAEEAAARAALAARTQGKA